MNRLHFHIICLLDTVSSQNQHTKKKKPKNTDWIYGPLKSDYLLTLMFSSERNNNIQIC